MVLVKCTFKLILSLLNIQITELNTSFKAKLSSLTII